MLGGVKVPPIWLPALSASNSLHSKSNPPLTGDPLCLSCPWYVRELPSGLGNESAAGAISAAATMLMIRANERQCMTASPVCFRHRVRLRIRMTDAFVERLVPWMDSLDARFLHSGLRMLAPLKRCSIVIHRAVRRWEEHQRQLALLGSDVIIERHSLEVERVS